MTTDELARSYLIMATKRTRVLDVLMEQEAYSDVVREAQELVELALKGVLRRLGIDPPKWHDVGPIILEQADRLPETAKGEVNAVVSISKWPRKEREFSFYGDIDFIPTEEYTKDDAAKAQSDALFVLKWSTPIISPAAQAEEKPASPGLSTLCEIQEERLCDARGRNGLRIAFREMLEQGIGKGECLVLQLQMAKRFGPLPEWADRILEAGSLEAVFQ